MLHENTDFFLGHAKILSSFMNRRVRWDMLVYLSFWHSVPISPLRLIIHKLSCVRQSFLSFCVWIWLFWHVLCHIQPDDFLVVFLVVYCKVPVGKHGYSHHSEHLAKSCKLCEKELLFHIIPEDRYVFWALLCTRSSPSIFVRIEWLWTDGTLTRGRAILVMIFSKIRGDGMTVSCMVEDSQTSMALAFMTHDSTTFWANLASCK